MRLLSASNIYSFPDALSRHLHLPGLQNLYVEHVVRSPEPLLSFLQETQGSLVSLSLNSKYLNFGGLGTLNRMYTLCPALKSLILDNTGPEDLASLTLSPHSKLWPALRRLILRNFTLVNADSACVIEDFCSSRGLAPFKTPNSPADSCQLDCITVYMTHEYCFKISSMLPPSR